MGRRTVSVELSLEVSAYLRNARQVDAATKDIREEIDRLSKAGASFGKIGLAGMFAGVPGMASAGAAGVGLLSATVLSGAAAMGAMKLATVGVGDAMTAVADGDAAALDEAMSKLSVEAQQFVREYTRVRGALDLVGDATQSALFAQLAGDLEQLTGAYIPVLLRQAPVLAREVGAIGTGFVDWATAPRTVAQINGQFDLAITLAGDLGRMLRAGTAILLDLADAGADFTRDVVGGLADGTEAMERWVSSARATGQLNQIFENGGRIIQRLGQFAAEAGEFLADVVDNPALVTGAEALFDVLHLGLDVVAGLLNAFELLPGGMQSGIVTLAVYGGAVLLVTGKVIALKAALDQASVSARTNATALKGVIGTLGGPWGIAIAAATIGLGLFTSQQADAEQHVSELAGSLDRQTGAITGNTRAVIAHQLEQDGLLKKLEQMGITSDRAVDAVLGNASAMDELTAATKRLDATKGWFTEGGEPTLAAIKQYQLNLDEATKSQIRETRAVGEGTVAVKAQTSAINELAAALKRQTDPVFALISAQQDLTVKQLAYNEAVKEHGRNSQQAKDASLELAKSAVVLTGAVGAAGDAFSGQMTPQLYATLKAAHLTDAQINDVARSFLAAAGAADQFEGDYKATLTAEAAKAKSEVDALIAKVAALKDKSIRISAQVYWTDDGNLHVPGGTQQKRWGGVTEHAQTGLLRDAAIYSPAASGARYAFAEPATGGEAFVPKYGDYGRSMSILSEAARWYQARVVPDGGGRGGGSTTTITHNLYVQPKNATFNGTDLRDFTRWHAVVSRESRAG